MSDGLGVSETFDEFEVVEDGERLRVSTPDGESVTLPAGWFGDDADWQDAYRAVLDDCLPDCLSVDDGAASVPRTNALVALRDAEDLSPGSAAALLAYLDAEGAVDCTGESVAVLFDPDDDRPARDPELTSDRWRVAVDALVAHLERLDDEVVADDGPSLEERAQEKLQATLEEVRDLGPGDGVPDAEDLDDDQRERFRELKKEFVVYKNLRDSDVSPERALEPGLSGRTDGLRELPDASPDPVGAFGTVAEGAAALDSVTEDGDVDVVRDRFAHLAKVLEDLDE